MKTKKIEQVDRTGPHINMSPEEIDDWYKKIKKDHKRYLKKHEVKLHGKETFKALQLVYLKKYERKLIHKDTISSFVRKSNKKAGKDQQVRHLAASGWYVLNKGDKLPSGYEFEDKSKIVKSGYHILISTKEPKPGYISSKRKKTLSKKKFDQLKKEFDYRCATCGSQENEKHLLYKTKITKLEKGHMDPNKTLTLDNCIPQCELCNKIYQDDYVFNKEGRVVAVASTKPVLKATEKVKEQIKKALK